MSSHIVIRAFNSQDTSILVSLFRDAVRAIAKRHYGPEQIAVWAPDEIDEKQWEKKLSDHITLVAEVDGAIVGFADMSYEGYLDHLYVHKDWQARFISVRLLKAIEQRARELGIAKITTDCSITAKVPALRMGFRVIQEQTIRRGGIELINYAMEKTLIS